MISPDAVTAAFAPKPRATVARVVVEGETVLMDEATGRLHMLDAVGSLVWACFDGSATLDELADDVSDAFGADRDAVREDLVDLVRRLGRLGLLEGVEPDEPQEGHEHGSG